MRVYILIISLIISGCGLKKKNNRELPKLVDIESKKIVKNKTINTNDLNYIDFNNLILFPFFFTPPPVPRPRYRFSLDRNAVLESEEKSKLCDAKLCLTKS